jgi:hypothetical protein
MLFGFWGFYEEKGNVNWNEFWLWGSDFESKLDGGNYIKSKWEGI